MPNFNRSSIQDNVNQVYLRVKNAYAAIQSEHLDMPTSMARLDTITFGEGDCDLQAEMTIDLARLKVMLLFVLHLTRHRLIHTKNTADQRSKEPRMESGAE